MILKINGIPVEEIVKEGIDMNLNFSDIYHLIHVPVDTSIGLLPHHNWLTLDLNVFNIPQHAFHFVQPHVNMVLEHLF